MVRIRRPLLAAALVALAGATAAPALAVAPDSTALISRPGGFGPLAAPVVNDSGTGGLRVGEQARRLVSDAENNRYVAFTSDADGLSAEDDDRFQNVFVRDRLTGRTILASRAGGAAGVGANSPAGEPSISPDGRFVAFTSAATNLTPDSVSGQETHVFVRDIIANTTVLVDRASGSNGAVADDGSSAPSVTTDAAQPVVAFVSGATNLGVNPGGFLQVYVRRASNQTTVLASAADATAATPGNQSSTQPSLSGDGTRVAFVSAATNLTAFMDDNVSNDVFVREPGANDTKFVTQASDIGDADSFSPSANEDGTKVAFASEATNFSNADGASTQDVFVWDDTLPEASDLILVSRASTTTGAAADQDAGEPSISATGGLVAFSSAATNLDPDDTNGLPDIFLRGGALGVSPTTGRVSETAPPARAALDGGSLSPSLALDGDLVAYTTVADNIGATDDDDFAQVYAQPLGLTISGPQHLSRPDGAEPFRSGVNRSMLRPRQRSEEAVDAMSADGRYTVFLSDEDDLAPDDVDAFTNVYRRDNLTGETLLVSRADGPAGAAADGPSATSGQGLVTGPGGPVGAPAISADGTRIAFASSATNLVAGDTNGQADVFVRDVAAGRTIRASVRPDGSQIPALGSGDPAISGDGLRVAFATREAMDGADANVHTDVYVRDLPAGTTTLASREAVAGDDVSTEPALDFDGSRVAFASTATNLAGGGANGTDADVFVRDLAAGQTFLASRRDGAAGVIGDDSSTAPALSDDGQRVAFSSIATNLSIGGDVNGGTRDVFVRDLAAGQTLLASRTSGANGISPTGASRRPSISGDGTRVAFETTAPDLVAGDQNGVPDVALRDLTAATTTLLSRAPGVAGALGNAASGDPALSGSGDCVAFTTVADDLVAQPPGVDFERVVARALRGDCPFGPVAGPPGAGPPATPGPPGGAAGDTTAPALSGLRAVPARFRAGLRLTPARRGRPAVGTTFRFTLSERGRVTITISRVLSGRRVKARCVAPRRGVRGRACVRLVRRGALSATGTAGANRVRFTGRLGRRLLAPGRYEARAVARDAAGNASRARTVRFVVLPRAR
jgi:Tol biopolymer transport system component